MQVQATTPTTKSRNQRRKFEQPKFIQNDTDVGEIYTDEEIQARVKQEFEPLMNLKHMRRIEFKYGFKKEADDVWLLTLSREEDVRGQIMTYAQSFRIVNDQTIPRIDAQIIEARLKFFE